MTASRLINRNVVAERGRTSMRLEPELWDALLEICERESQDMSTLVRQVEQAGHQGGRTSAVRVFVLGYYRAAATESGHGLAGHGGLPRSRLPRAARSAALGAKGVGRQLRLRGAPTGRRESLAARRHADHRVERPVAGYACSRALTRGLP